MSFVDDAAGLLGRLEYLRDRMEQFANTVNGFDGMVNARTSHIAQAASTAVTSGPMDVTVPWPGDGFASDQYEVDIVPLTLVGKGEWSVVEQQPTFVKVRLTATIAVTGGTPFLVYGRS